MSTQEPYRLQVAKGQIEGASVVHQFGVNPDLDSGQEETIMWTDSTRYFQPYPTSAQTMYVNSTSANDDGDSGVSSGIRTMRLEGLNENYELVSEDITMQGRTQVATANTYIRVFRITALTVGSNGHQFGDIYVATSGLDGATFRPTGDYYLRVDNSVSAPENISAAAIYTVPAGHTLYLDLLQFKSTIRGALTTLAHMNFVTRPAVTDAPFTSLIKYAFREPILDFPFPRPLAIAEKTDIECRGVVDAAGSNFDVTASFTGILVKN